MKKLLLLATVALGMVSASQAGTRLNIGLPLPPLPPLPGVVIERDSGYRHAPVVVGRRDFRGSPRQWRPWRPQWNRYDRYDGYYPHYDRYGRFDRWVRRDYRCR